MQRHCSLGPVNTASVRSDSARVFIDYDENSSRHRQALSLIRKGDLAGAESIYRELIFRGCRDHIVYANLAALCGMLGKREQLLPLLRTALELNPNSAQSHNNLGIALKQQDRLDEAISAYECALSLKPNSPDVYNNLGNALLQQRQLDAAIDAYKKSLQLDPKSSSTHSNLAHAFLEQGQLQSALQECQQSLALDPGYAEAHWNRSQILFHASDYPPAWIDYEWRFKLENPLLPHASPCGRVWDGEDLDGVDKILLVTEQGIGDNLQFLRYVLALRRHDVDVSVCAPRKLHGLIKASGLDPHPLTPQQGDEVRDGRWIPLLSLPRHLGVTPEQPIIQAPYLESSAVIIQKWRQIFAQSRCHPVVAINWQGNPQADQLGLPGRSLPLEDFAPLLSAGQFFLLSLQKGFGAEQLDHCSFRDRFVPFQDQVNATWDFLDIAAIMDNCDLIVTTDSAVAHLAGGLGRPTWLLLKQVPNWRWGLQGDTSFWYPSMRLFRQTQSCNWHAVLHRAAQELSHFLHRNGGVCG